MHAISQILCEPMIQHDIYYTQIMKKILSIPLLFVTWTTFAAIPNNYYSSADGKSSTAILQALHAIIDNHTVISYDNLEPYYEQTDMDSTGHIWDMYSTCLFTMKDANHNQKNVCDAWNKEHSVPQSWFKEKSPMKSDLFHVVPTDARVNNFRGNMPYGETSSRAYIDNDKNALGYKGTSVTSSIGQVFEPIDEYKGDFARIYFYMVTRYLDMNLAQSEGSKVFAYQGGTLSFTSYAVALFLKWHRQDPVSKKEIDRNNAVYGIQHNRNPFVDYPYLVEYIWGKEKSTSLNMATQLISSEDPQFVPNVSDGSWASVNPTIRPASTSVTFPSVLAGQSTEQTFSITGANLNTGIYISLSGTNADLFDVSPSFIVADKANQTNLITLTYRPLAIGHHSATLTLSSEGAESVAIAVSGSCASECTIVWKVDGQVYTTGNPTTKVALGSVPEVIPTVPQSCSDESPQFVGWSASLIDSIIDDAPADLFSDVSEMHAITEDVTYHAVFAKMVEKPGTAAQTDIIDFTKGYTNAQAVTTAKEGVTTVTFIQHKASNEAKYYTNGTAVRTYANSQVKIEAKGISKIEFTFGSEDHNNPITVNVGSLSDDDKTWIGEADEVLFSIGGTSKFRAISAIKVTSQESTTVYDYSRYMTSCTTVPITENIVPITSEKPSAKKVLRHGQLMIEREGLWYNALGVMMK